QGDLVSVPDEAAYGEGFHKEAMGLAAPPRVDNYRGLYFVSFDGDVEDLISYLGDAKEYIDLILDQAEEGWRVVPGTQKYSVRANWKMFSLNSLDSYHVRPLHSTFVKYTESLGSGDPPPLPPTESRPAGAFLILTERSRSRYLSVVSTGEAYRSLAPHSRRGIQRGNWTRTRHVGWKTTR